MPNLNIFGHINKTGVGTHTQFLLKELDINSNVLNNFIPLGVIDQSLSKISYKPITGTYQKGVDVVIDTLSGAIKALNHKNLKHNSFQNLRIAYVVFETINDPKVIRDLRTCLAMYDYLFVPSDFLKKEVSKYYPQCIGMVFVVPEGTDCYNRASIIHYKSASPVFGVIGKYERRKGHDSLIGILPALESYLNENLYTIKMKILFYCDNFWNQRAYETIVDNQNFKHIELQKIPSFKYRDELIDHYVSNCNFGIFPSYSEAWGLPILDSMALGIPTITLNASGMEMYTDTYRKLVSNKDLILDIDSDNPVIEASDGKFFSSGQFPNYNSNRLLDTIVHCLRYPEEQILDNMSLGNYMFNTFSWEKSANTFVETIERCINERNK